ncbi:class I SAM-dependent methyltransferase [Sneathiella chinensis]|uniref:Methyltransferase domain-containing protein n=1 Tax=Sneathiella chinensis TaxID=349750 RepID=A0ABQ5U2E8_9PROT|nr:class I SAM-dependent methyltransferase [Sneathiella chinensis]GLQ05586.1 hypothetical protein GCM10007924_08070 [Sneathiella chinensis]
MKTEMAATPEKQAKWAADATLHYKKGRTEKGRKLASRIDLDALNDPQLCFQTGAAALYAKDIETAISFLEQGRTLQTGDQELQTNLLAALGTAYTEISDFKKAEDAFGCALVLSPDHVASLNNRGLLYRKTNDLERAKVDFQKAHSLTLDNPGILLNLTGVLRQMDLKSEAHDILKDALVLHPNNCDILSELGSVLISTTPLEAFTYIRKAIHLEPENPRYLNLYTDALGLLPTLKNFDGMETDLLILLSSDMVQWNRLNFLILQHIRSQPAFVAAQEEINSAVRQNRDLNLDFGTTLKVMLNNVLLAALKRTRLVDPDIEKVLELFRRQSLATLTGIQNLDPSILNVLKTLLVRLSHYCFATEHVFSETDFERQTIEKLATSLEASGARIGGDKALYLLILSCYRNLHTYPFAKAALKSRDLNQDPEIAEILRIQIAEPLSEKQSYGEFEQITPISDAISVSVRDQYEENPYPRWQHLGLYSSTRYATDLARKLPTLNKQEPPFPDHPNVLIAGCGTGRQPISSALAYPECDILAVDLSLASLAYANRKAKEKKVRNIRFAQGDIMELGSIGQKFNVIECAGVLHHMNDPLAGWKVLVDLLEDDGYMMIGLYSEIGRQDIVAARAFIAEQEYSDSADDIRRSRKDLMALPSDHPASRIPRHSDFYTTSACRDLIFHVQEHRFTLPQLASSLDQLGLEFLGFTLDLKTAEPEYREAFPDDPLMTNLDNWHQYEQKRPTTFATMYKFWCRKKTG